MLGGRDLEHSDTDVSGGCSVVGKGASARTGSDEEEEVSASMKGGSGSLFGAFESALLTKG